MTLASEIASLSEAYNRMVPGVVGSDAPVPARTRDHMLWAQPWTTEQSISETPYPFIDCRRVRLVPAGGGLMGAVLVSGPGARVDVGLRAISRTRTPRSRLRAHPTNWQKSVGGRTRFSMQRLLALMLW